MKCIFSVSVKKKLKQKKVKKNKVDQEEQEMLSKKYHIRMSKMHMI